MAGAEIYHLLVQDAVDGSRVGVWERVRARVRTKVSNCDDVADGIQKARSGSDAWSHHHTHGDTCTWRHWKVNLSCIVVPLLCCAYDVMQGM
jgi:hypothetical protein